MRIKFSSVQFSSFQSLSHLQLFVTPWIAARQASLSILEFIQTHVHRVSDAIQPSHPLSSLLLLPPIPPSFRVFSNESFPFRMSQLFASGGQNIGVSASASVLPMNTQDWSPSEWAGWISLQSKGLSRVFSNTTVQNHRFFSIQLSLRYNSHIHTWPLEKP